MGACVPASSELCDSNVFDSQILMILQHMYFDNSLGIGILSFKLLMQALVQVFFQTKLGQSASNIEK